MQISNKTTGRLIFFFCVKRSVSDRQLEKITVRKAQAKVVKYAKKKKKKCWAHRSPPWSLKR